MWDSFTHWIVSPTVPIVSQLCNMLSKFSRMCTALQTMELCLILFFFQQTHNMKWQESTYHVHSIISLVEKWLFRYLGFPPATISNYIRKPLLFINPFGGCFCSSRKLVSLGGCWAKVSVFCVSEENVRLFSERVMQRVHGEHSCLSQAPSVSLAVAV